MQKLHNWQTSLALTITANQDKHFEWGTFDCCLFAADCVKAMTGQDPAQEFRGKYKTRLGAARKLKELGAGDLESTLNDKLGEPVPGYPQKGDICLVDTEDGPAAGVVFSRVIWVPGPTGLQAIKQKPKAVWRV
jgi:hypothetical protein